MENILREKAAAAGIFECGTVKTTQLNFREDIRNICAGESCGQYGRCWACPPAVGTLEECKERCLRYENMLVFTGKYDMDGPFDFAGWKTSMKDFKKLVWRFDEEIKDMFSDYMLFWNEGCGICKECTYPDSECRFPDKMHHALEGYGLWVSELASLAGIKYNNGENTVTYFGALLY
ncbi:MAG: DUF2284 domain-containing protein [Anaerofustis stercorihominis]|nr:DUF2284 domain-containing protein [Anaerofustis stercorihominis]